MMKAMPGVLNYRELLFELTTRELKARYKQSLLGYAWVVLNPLFQMVVMAFVFSTILRISSPGVPYAIFLYVGLLPWNFFTNAVNGSAQALVANSTLITKIYFPREILVVATLLAKGVDFLFASSLLLFFFLFYGQTFHWTALLFIPLFLIQLVMTFGIGLLTAALNLLYRDVQYVLTLVLTIWMYLTPVVYPAELVPEKYVWLFNLNPFTQLVTAYRDVLISGSVPSLNVWATILGHMFFFLFIGWAVFKKLESIFADSI